jgi:hypothetical protein
MRILRFLLTTCLIVTACSPGAPPAEHEDIGTFIETFSECARVYRVFSENDSTFADELGQVDFPENWNEMVDSLTAHYGGDVDFWMGTFTEIANRSRR